MVPYDWERSSQISGVPLSDITTFLPARAARQLEQALVAAAGVVNAYGRWELGRVAWKAGGLIAPDQNSMFRAWLGTFPEATGERHAMWMPDLFAKTVNSYWFGPAHGKRSVCANTGGDLRGACPAVLNVQAGPATIRVPAHVDNVSLANTAKLAAGGADPADTVAIIAVITHPDRD